MMANRQSGVEDLTNPAADLGASCTDKIAISAVELARLVYAAPSDVHYWGRSGYLRRLQGSPGYPLDQLRKAQLMAVFTKRLQMKSSKASELADDLLQLCQDRADGLTTTIALVRALESHITEFVALIVDLGLVSSIADILRKEKMTPT
jgi:hypothetical protein